MNDLLENETLDQFSFAYRDIIGQDKWVVWTPNYSFATATSLTVTGRYRVVGKQCFFQVKSTGTSLATTGGTSYIDMPITAKGLGGSGVMDNLTSHLTVGTGPIDPATNRFYPPTVGASGNDFIFSGSYEV